MHPWGRDTPTPLPTGWARRALYEGHYAYADVEAEQGRQEPIL